jgi:TonB family protein
MLWIAFACAAGIHLGAVVLAKSKSEKNTVQELTPLEADVQIIDAQPQPESAQELITPPPLDQIRPDEDVFVEENRTRPPVHARKKARAVSLVKSTTALFGSVKALVMYAPRPAYPYEARRQRITGSGIALLTVDPTNGEVTDTKMVQSCGSVILDNAALDAFRRWRFKRGASGSVRVPITYTLMGASY